MPENKVSSHLSQNTSLATAINSWEMYLADQGRSPNTIKAFLSDVRLLTTFLPEDTTIGPWFGFSESTLVGPGAYLYNSGPVPGPHNCNRLIPIMGPSPERSTTEAVHNFTHRFEATMTKVYGSWQQNRTAHNWEIAP